MGYKIHFIGYKMDFRYYKNHFRHYKTISGNHQMEKTHYTTGH